MNKPLFTKRHFEVLARIIAEHESRSELIWDIPTFWASKLQQYNPNFDHDRFIKACKQP